MSLVECGTDQQQAHDIKSASNVLVICTVCKYVKQETRLTEELKPLVIVLWFRIYPIAVDSLGST